jgi:hypothetical protein
MMHFSMIIWDGIPQQSQKKGDILSISSPTQQNKDKVDGTHA